MRVALIGPFPPLRGGIAQFTRMLADQLEVLGHELLRVSYSRLYPGPLFPGTSQYDADAGRAASGVAIPIDSCWPPSWLRTRRMIRSFEPDLLIASWWHPFFALSTLGVLPRELRESTILICHNVLPHERFPLASLLTAMVLRRAGRLITHGRSDEGTAGRLAPSVPVDRLFLPVYRQYLDESVTRDGARSGLGLSHADVALLFFGLVRPYKGVDDLLAAMRLLPRNARLYIVGEGYSRREPSAAALQDPHIRDRITRVDRFVDPAEVARFFEASDIVVLPYREATQSAVAQVALAFRKPMVLTRTGGLPELVEEGVTGTLARPGDPEDLARAIDRCIGLLDDAGLPLAVERFAARFSWPVYAESLLDTVREAR